MDIATKLDAGVVCDLQNRRTFCPAEADRAIVLLKRVVGDCVCEYSRLQDLHEAVEAAEGAAAWDRWEEARTGLIRSAGRLRGYLQELHDVGVELRDWTAGVVDFPAMAGERPVWLCWRLGEEHVEWWHEGEECEVRRPMSELPAYQHPQPAFRG